MGGGAGRGALVPELQGRPTGAHAKGAHLHLGGMANAVMTETPYTLVLTACVLALVRHLTRGGA